MPNVSELQRMTEELEGLKRALSNSFSKAAKRQILDEIRRLEAALGIESKPYNGGM